MLGRGLLSTRVVLERRGSASVWPTVSLCQSRLLNSLSSSARTTEPWFFHSSVFHFCISPCRFGFLSFGWSLWNSSDVNMMYCSFGSCALLPYFPVAHGWKLPSAFVLRSPRRTFTQKHSKPDALLPTERPWQAWTSWFCLGGVLAQIVGYCRISPSLLVLMNVALFQTASIGRSWPLPPDVFHSFSALFSTLKADVDVPVFLFFSFFFACFFDVTEVIEMPSHL